MKRYLFIVCAVAYSALASAFTRLTPETYHFVSIHADAGYSTLLHTLEGRPASPGMNGIIGLDYRLYHNNFLFSVGAEGMYQLSANKMEDLDVMLPMIDTEGDFFNMHVQVDKARDLAHMVNVNIPILVGGEWKRFYFMVGPKVSINMYGVTASNAEITTYGEYERYYDDFYNMPNHQFASDQKMSSAVLPMKWNFNIMAHAEIGGRIGHMYKHKQFRLNPDKVRMFLAAYVDFGVLNLVNSSDSQPIFDYRETEDTGVQFFIQPLLRSNLAAGQTFRNLNAGIKFTVAFEMPQHGKSYIYDMNKVDRDYRKRGGNQGIK